MGGLIRPEQDLVKINLRDSKKCFVHSRDLREWWPGEVLFIFVAGACELRGPNGGETGQALPTGIGDGG